MLRPATKYLTNTVHEQIDHLRSEFIEVIAEYNANDYEKMAEEIVDLQMSCETLLAIIGLDEYQRIDARKKVVCKNWSRGYYNKPTNEQK